MARLWRMLCATPLCTAVVVAAGGCDRSRCVVGVESAASYVLSCAKSGGFGPADQPYKGLHWTAHAVHALDALQLPIPDSARCREYVAREIESGGPSDLSDEEVEMAIRFGLPPGRSPRLRVRSSQRSHGGWDFSPREPSLTATLRSVSLLAAAKSRPANVERAARFAVERLHRNGRFTSSPRRDSSRSPGHLRLTHCGVRILHLLGYDVPWRAAVVRWVQSCQTEDGGFASSPGARAGSRMWTTWLAVSALRTLDAAPLDSAGVIAYVSACQNADGGFSDSPGRASRLSATRYALETLELLAGSPGAGLRPHTVPLPETGMEYDAVRVRCAYRGPMPTDGEDTSVRSAGLPVYRLAGSVDNAIAYLALPEIAVRDSTLSSFMLALDMPPVALSVGGDDSVVVAVSAWMMNGGDAGTCDAVRRAWGACGDVRTWEGLATRVVEPIVSHGGRVCVSPIVRESHIGLMALDEIARIGRRQGVMLAGAGVDGRDMIRERPWLESARGIIPFGVDWAGAVSGGEGGADLARMAWFDCGEAGPSGLLCIVLAEGDREAAIYGIPAAAAALRVTKSWEWWR